MKHRADKAEHTVFWGWKFTWEQQLLVEELRQGIIPENLLDVMLDIEEHWSKLRPTYICPKEHAYNRRGA